jgi:hypothetical protein
MKRIVILGTNHCVQWRDYDDTNQFEQILRILSVKYSTQVVLEEWTPREAWCPSSMSTVGHRLANEQGLPWMNVGPDEAEFSTDEIGDLTHGSVSVRIRAYGPIQNQTGREESMLRKIKEIMDGYSDGLFVCGLAHLHSMAEKLANLEFAIEAYQWQRPEN